MTALFDEDEIARRYHLEIQRNAEKKKSEDIVKNMLELGTMSYEDIAGCTKLPVSEIEKLANLQPV